MCLAKNISQTSFHTLITDNEIISTSKEKAEMFHTLFSSNYTMNPISGKLFIIKDRIDVRHNHCLISFLNNGTIHQHFVDCLIGLSLRHSISSLKYRTIEREVQRVKSVPVWISLSHHNYSSFYKKYNLIVSIKIQLVLSHINKYEHLALFNFSYFSNSITIM